MQDPKGKKGKKGRQHDWNDWRGKQGNNAWGKNDWANSDWNRNRQTDLVDQPQQASPTTDPPMVVPKKHSK